MEALTLPQVRRLHRERMRKDFPPDELKPLGMIEKALASGGYLCLGAVEAGEILAYAFFVLLGQTALVDYLAVRENLRDRGIGTRFLRKLMVEQLTDFDCVLLEVDDPAAAPNAAERAHRLRRLRFYLGCGLRETGVSATVWGVEYRILALPVGEDASPARVSEVYAALYRAVLPSRFYESKVRIHADSPGTEGEL